MAGLCEGGNEPPGSLKANTVCRACGTGISHEERRHSIKLEFIKKSAYSLLRVIFKIIPYSLKNLDQLTVCLC
ncbi:hypothetical protein ANN_09282 [Periplaneta americana]|uniref:Uncharacterized protein n=1 Tax=Periplaneta americana TaxID=6978 RepID=A0ABQ8TLU8_PERAM|nr:hypothetical protein ANN_09282 [Periplaneta americana]